MSESRCKRDCTITHDSVIPGSGLRTHNVRMNSPDHAMVITQVYESYEPEARLFCPICGDSLWGKGNIRDDD